MYRYCCCILILLLICCCCIWILLLYIDIAAKVCEIMLLLHIAVEDSVLVLQLGSVREAETERQRDRETERARDRERARVRCVRERQRGGDYRTTT